MSWIYLLFAGFSEVGWAVGMKYTDGFSKIAPSVITVALMLASFGLLSMALKELPLSTAYAVWTGIGTVGTFLFGFFVLHEPATAWNGLCVAMIVCGIVGLKLLA